MILKTLKEILIRYHIGAFMAITFLFFSCTKDKLRTPLSTPNNALSTIVNKKAVSNEDVFRGVMFLEGPVAKLLNDFKEFNIRTFTTDQSKINAATSFQDNVITKLKEKEPYYFKNFRDKVGSDDYYEVKSTILKAANDIYGISVELSGKNKKEITSSTNLIINKFLSKHNLNLNSRTTNFDSTKNSLLNAATDATAPGPYYDTETAVKVVVAAAAVIAVYIVVAVFIVLAAKPMDNVNTYMTEKFISDVTINLSGI